VRRELIDELKVRVGLNDEQARRAVEVFEGFLRERAEDQKQFQGLFTGAIRPFEDRG
jgi:hypothetical protein